MFSKSQDKKQLLSLFTNRPQMLSKSQGKKQPPPMHKAARQARWRCVGLRVRLAGWLVKACGWLTVRLAGWLADGSWLAGWLTVRLAGWLAEGSWLAGWLTVRLAGWLADGKAGWLAE
jgi:hypothetical protein